MRSANERPGTRLWVAALVAASVVTGAAAWHSQSVAEDKTTPPVAQTPQHKEDFGHAKALSHAFRAAADATIPSVVTVMSEVRTRQVRGNGRGENPFKGTPYEEFFKDRGGMPFNMPAPERRSGVGAGVIIDKSGVILTNNHVVEGATEVTVRLSDGREFQGFDIKTDKSSDLAVVHIKPTSDLPAATLGDSDKIAIGDWVLAVGNPFNQEMTVSAGIISGKGRSLSGQRAQYLQTDAAINPGNSGGPLVDLDGEVVGINTAIASSSGGFQGVGFAIPINQAKWVADQLVHGGSVKRAYLGVVVGEIGGDLAEQFGVHRHEGVFVNEVVAESPAAKAGVQEGDVITDFAGKHVGTPGQLQQLVERTPPATKEDVKLIRDGKAMTLKIGVEAMPEESRVEVRNVRGTEKEASPHSFTSNELGLEVAELKAAEAEQLGYKGVEGVVITGVAPDGLAAEHGLSDGMVIKKVGKQAVTTVEEFKKALADQSSERGVLLLVRTPEGNSFVVLKK